MRDIEWPTLSDNEMVTEEDRSNPAYPTGRPCRIWNRAPTNYAQDFHLLAGRVLLEDKVSDLASWYLAMVFEDIVTGQSLRLFI